MGGSPYRKPNISNKRLIILFIILLIIKLLSLNSSWIENHYSIGLFSSIAVALRTITGWLPVSLGDLLYLGAFVWLFKRLINAIIVIRKKKATKNWWLEGLKKTLVIGASIYIIFNLFWGLNYNRKGIAYQLGLKVTHYTVADLKLLDSLLVEKVNYNNRLLATSQNRHPKSKELYERAVNCYSETSQQYPFLVYKKPSIKSSMFSKLESYLGFTGYYNPFTGEAQVNNVAPSFTRPYTATHEMAHQLGYAREDEANFVGYLAASSSTDTLFHYSTYFDLFTYANHEVYLYDSSYAKAEYKSLDTAVKVDLKEIRDFWRHHENPVEPVISWMYGKYLMANQQPKGVYTYNEVIANLIAFYKKYGRI